MKYFKLFLLVAAIAFFGSCSDDKETQNTNSDVVVEMESPTFSAKESAGSVKVPIKVTGKTNGKVYVTMAVKECGNNPAKEDVHYYVADKTITISDEIGYVEYRAVDDKKIKSAGVSGVMHPGKNNVQVVIGMQVQFVADEFKKLCK